MEYGLERGELAPLKEEGVVPASEEHRSREGVVVEEGLTQETIHWMPHELLLEPRYSARYYLWPRLEQAAVAVVSGLEPAVVVELQTEEAEEGREEAKGPKTTEGVGPRTEEGVLVRLEVEGLPKACENSEVAGVAFCQ